LKRLCVSVRVRRGTPARAQKEHTDGFVPFPPLPGAFGGGPLPGPLGGAGSRVFFFRGPCGPQTFS